MFLSIPVDALMRGNQVYIKDDSVKEQSGPVPAGFKAVEVETGLTNDSYVEIKSGLSEGDTVYVAKSSTDSSSFFMGWSGEWAVPAVEWAARQVAAVMGGGNRGGGMAAVVQDRVIHNRAGQCEKCGNSERSFYVPFT